MEEKINETVSFMLALLNKETERVLENPTIVGAAKLRADDELVEALLTYMKKRNDIKVLETLI